ncbi:MAG: hypothetical protein Q8K75_07525 [Chlamydiales bacterium]|nr:hypothetical protein [Chlamydiales bacterium]
MEGKDLGSGDMSKSQWGFPDPSISGPPPSIKRSQSSPDLTKSMSQPPSSLDQNFEIANKAWSQPMGEQAPVDFAEGFEIVEFTDYDRIDTALHVIIESNSQGRPATNYQMELRTLKEKVGLLTADQKEELKPLMLSAYVCLQTANNQVKEPVLKQEIFNSMREMRVHNSYLTDNLAKLSAFAGLGRSLMNNHTDPSEHLLCIQNNVLGCKQSTWEPQLSVLHHISSLKTALRDPKVTANLSNQELLEIKYLACWGMATYYLNQASGLNNVEHVFNELEEINNQVGDLIDAKDDIKSDPQMKVAFGMLTDLYTQKIVFPDFWTDSKHFDNMKLLEPYIADIRQFIRDPQKTDKLSDKLVFQDKDDANGLALYKLAGQEDTYMVFMTNRESFLSNYNPFQATEGALGGLIHGPIAQHAKDAEGPLNDMLMAKNPKKIITVGFGENGSTGQVLATKLALANDALQTVSLCVGSAPYVDDNAAWTVRQRPNHYGMNVQLVGDAQLEPSWLNKWWGAKTYSTDNFQASLKAHNRDWTLANTMNRGHDPGIYADKTKRALEQPLLMHSVYQQLRELAN